MSTELEQLLARREELGKERDLCAELYNVWITKLHDLQLDRKKYELYAGMIQNMEPYANTIKEEYREINRRICEIEGVDSIEDTEYMRKCVYKYGFDRPNEDN